MAGIMVKFGVNVQGDHTFPKILFMSMFTHKENEFLRCPRVGEGGGVGGGGGGYKWTGA
jgi:hypothetical protein